MLRRFLLSLFTLCIFTSAIAAQDAQPAPSPSPKPAVKRRAFDQFDLSNGPGRGSSSSSSSAPSVVEQVNLQTYEGVSRMVTYALQIESEYRSSEGTVIEARDVVLARKAASLYRIIEIYQKGLLDETPLKDPVNVALLEKAQTIVVDIGMVANWKESEIVRYQDQIAPIAEKYGVTTSPIERRPLVSAMFGRLNANLSLLMKQVAVSK